MPPGYCSAAERPSPTWVIPAAYALTFRRPQEPPSPRPDASPEVGSAPWQNTAPPLSFSRRVSQLGSPANRLAAA